MSCVSVAVGIQHTSAILPSVTCPVLQHFSTLPRKQRDFRKNIIEHKMCVLIFSTIVSKEVHSKIKCERNVIIDIYWSSCKVTINLVRFYRNLNLLDRFSKNIHISNFMKIRPVGNELFHADRCTDR